MPSLAFSAESDEALKQLLASAPQSPSDSKAKSVENYSPVVDLRNSTKTQLDAKVEELNSLSYITTQLSSDDINKIWQRNVTSNTTIQTSPAFLGNPTLESGTTTISNGATLRYQLTPTTIFQEYYSNIFLTFGKGNHNFVGGGNFFVDVNLSNTTPNNGALYQSGILNLNRDSKVTFDTNVYVDIHNNSSNNVSIGAGVFTLGFIGANHFNSWSNTLTFNNDLGIRIEKRDNISGANIYSSSISTAKANAFNVASRDSYVYINANANGDVHNKNNKIQIENASIYLNYTPKYPDSDRGIVFRANFSNSSSFLYGDYAVAGSSDSTISSSNITFSNGATWKGNAIFDYDDSKDSSIVTLNSASWEGKIYDLKSPSSNTVQLLGSTFTGEINATNNANTSYVFNQSSFIGSIKGGSWSSNSFTANGGGGVNTTITFKRTAGRIFGDGTNNIVDSSYKGTIIGSFDVSVNSGATINGGTNGDKGFFGSGTNTLTFDFRNNASSSSSNSAFTIGGGNANSVYVMNAFQAKGQTELDLSSLNTSTTLYKKLENAGIKIAVDTSSQNTNKHLNGTLLFTNTNIKVDNNNGGDKALFAKAENIVGSNNNLNGLALGAMFGNATWNDANKDGYITSDEIIANAGGANYKLSTSPAVQSRTDSSNTDDKTSTGNIGKDSDGIKKQIGFIFANGTETNQGYVFGGDKQGYSGIIKGGTDDSKYYFANAGYVNRTQIEDAKGDLVLFNTAFRGDLGVKNKDVSVMLDFSDNRNGLRAETDNGNANIVGSGSKNITFNFTGNTLKEKFKGAVVGDATKANTNGRTPTNGGSSTDSDTATYTMLNLKKYSSDGQLDGNGAISASADVRGERTNKTLIDAIQGAGLTNFDNPSGNNLGNHYGTATRQKDSEANQKDTETNIEAFSKTNTTLALRGTSLDASGITFNDYKYDFAFGSGLGEIEGVTIQNSKLKGTIDLSGNSNKGHKIVMRGDSIEGGSAEIKFKAGNFSSSSSGGGVFVYDDYTATRSASSTAPTLKLSGLSQTNYLGAGSEINISNTNLEGDIWADKNVNVKLDFRDGRTWKMDESGIYIKNASDSFRITGKVATLSNNRNTTTPTLKIRHDVGTYYGRMEFINTGMIVKLWEQGGGWGRDTYMGNSFNLRGTSLETYWGNGGSSGSKDGLHGYTDEGIKLVFAKGTNVETNVEKSQKDGTSATYYKITDEGSGEGNYIAESYGKITKVVTKGKADIVFIGESSHNADLWTQGGSYFGQDSKITFVNASNGANSSNGLVNGALDGSKIGNFTNNNGSGNSNARLDITLEGTSLTNGNSLVTRTDNQDKLFFNITFVKGSNTDSTQSTYSSPSTYIGTKYADIAQTTNANGALAQSVLKVAESSLNSGVDFKGSNFNVLFVGDGSQTLSNSNVFKGGSTTSKVTFRDSNLNAGNGTSSLQNIAGTIAFDLSHNDEDMQISGTLSNMFGTSSSQTSYNGTGKYQTKFGEARGDQADGLVIDKLVFVKVGSSSGESGQANTLSSLKDNGNYFNDTDTFGSLANTDYSTIGYIKDLNDSNNSSLTLAGGATVALKDANQEIVFIGSESHGFDDNGTIKTGAATKLGDSEGSTLTFIDAGTLKVDNLINKKNDGTQQGKGTINLIGSTRIETQTLSASSSGSSSSSASNPSAIAEASGTTKTLTLYKAGTTTTTPSTSALTTSTSTSAITGKGITINAVFTGSNALAQDNNQTIQTYANTGVNRVTTADSGKQGASTANIGQVGEETIYHILFDYTSSDLTFGTHHAYAGNITGLTSDSVIKFKNAGYINQAQIQNTQATILLDNTQLKGDFRGDVAILDFRNNRPAISGKILTSDTRTQPQTPVLSQKVLTFDLTGSTNALGFSGVIQAGYKIAPDYSQDGQSVLTFQNAPTMTLGNDNGASAGRGTGKANSSMFIQSLAKDVGFSGIANAETEEPTSQAQTPANPSVGTIALATAPTPLIAQLPISSKAQNLSSKEQTLQQMEMTKLSAKTPMS